MNLKNSKFYKRIQELRRFSKEKIRKDREQRTSVRLDMALSEQRPGHDSDFEWSSSPRRHISPRRRIKKTKTKKKLAGTRLTAGKDTVCSSPADEELQPDDEIQSYIQLNDKCYRLSCTRQLAGKDSRVDASSISEAKSAICVSNSRYAMIGKISKTLGYKLVKETKLWNILWSDSFPGVELFKNMKRFQQINHFPGMIEICRKDLLSRNLNRMFKVYPHDYKIFPKTWMLPADYGDAMNYALTHKRTFILKPDSGAQGRGIWLTNDLKTIGANERLICQTYVHRPLLIDGYKFDLRVYTLITSVDPLRIFVYNEGLARFATNKYVEPTSGNTTDLYMHLTNYSVNKRNSHYELCDNDDCGSKRKLSAINNWMSRHNYDVKEFWTNVDDVIIKTVLSAWPVLKHNYHACFPGHDKIQACFEILGFDILVDWKLKPYILEVNHSPSFHTNEQVDREVKRPLIRDTLSLVSAVLADKRQIMREDRKRVKQRLLKTKGETLQRPRANGGSSIGKPKIDGSHTKVEPEEELDSLAQQIAWEDSHMGNFRRIMPPVEATKAEYYSQFYGQTNQVSIFAETAASKKREDLARKMRLQIEEKKAKQDMMLNGRNKTDKRKRQVVLLPRAVREKNRVQLYRLQEHWVPGFISDAEERLRHTWLQMRSEAIRSLRITESVYATLYEAGNLSNTDMAVYPHLYQHLQNGFDIKQHI
ncbi:tubulin polyglutamylase TTLL13P [Drosophila guanche]|uniref:Blast:Tubulin polyglutamylase TTLL13 n=1 Tax=Drosophila guanche TaxID=7266 RepID=A0A3B0K4R6_DROGU|nr:tubulin polyglutamylase TTLL13P [Drosophila guanche]SPP80989.1 blast:Tubulin polyglutamylase TTLL13 [Drosophila guanche]